MGRAGWAKLWPWAALQFCFIAAVAMAKPATNALVLTRFSTSVLPWLYLVAAVIASVLAVVGSGRRRSPVVLAVFGGAVLALLAICIWLQVPFASVAAYLFVEAFSTQLSLSVWSRVADDFDPREARRAFAWINGLGMGGAIVGGLVAQGVARTAGALALMGFGAVMLLLGASSQLRARRGAAPTPPATVAPMAWSDVIAAPYLRLLAGLVLGWALVQPLVDYAFRARALGGAGEAELADFFAAQQLWTGVFCVAFQLTSAEVLLRRIGVLRYVAAVPLAVGGAAIAAWAWPSPWAAWSLKVFESAASWSLLPVAFQLLYAPLPDALRDRARRALDGVVRKLGLGAAGLALLAVAAPLGIEGVLGLIALIAAALTVNVWLLRQGYVAAIQARVAGEAPGQLGEEQALLLRHVLDSASPQVVLRAAALLEHADQLTTGHVALMMAHPHELVQERGVRLSESKRLVVPAEAFERLIAGGTRRPRDASVWALARLHPRRAMVVLPPLLATTDIGLAAATVGGLWVVSGGQHPGARRTLESMLLRGAHAPAAERREVARLLGRISGPEVPGTLARYLDDADPSVRLMALRAVGEGRWIQAAPRVLRGLTRREERAEGQHALVALGDRVVPLLAETLDDRSKSLALRLQLPRALRRIGTQSALNALLFSNAYDEPSLHHRVGTALAQLHQHERGLEIDHARVTQALHRRLEAAQRLAPLAANLRHVLDRSNLLLRVVNDRLVQSFELSIRLLGLRHDPRSLQRAAVHLLGGDTKRRAWALELLEATLSSEERALVKAQLAFLEDSVAPVADLATTIAELCEFDDVVLRSLARHSGRRQGGWSKPAGDDEMNPVTMQRLLALEGVEVFAQSDVDDVTAVAALARELTFDSGQRVYDEGDPGDALYVIVAGTAEARREGEVVMRLREKESFGETSLFDGAPRINSVVATSALRVLCFDRRDFLDVLADRPELLAGMFRVLSRQFKAVVVEMAHQRRASVSEMPAVKDP